MLNLKNIKKDILSGGFLLRVRDFLSGKIKVFVFALFFILSGGCIYIWYAYAHNYHWSAEQKAEYMKTKDKEVTFNRKKFQEIVEKEKERMKEYNRSVEIKKDIFRIE